MLSGFQRIGLRPNVYAKPPIALGIDARPETRSCDASYRGVYHGYMTTTARGCGSVGEGARTSPEVKKGWGLVLVCWNCAANHDHSTGGCL